MLQLDLEWLTPVSLLKSDRWLAHFASNKAAILTSNSPDKLRALATSALMDYQFYHPTPFRKEDCAHALDRWVSFESESWDVLECLGRLNKELLHWQGDCFVAKPAKLELWSAFIARIDPVWIIAHGYAQMIHQNLFNVEQLLGSDQQQGGFALRKDYKGKKYADNHVHLGGHGDYSLALIEFSLNSLKTKDSFWPPMPECPTYESGSRSKHELPYLVRWFCDYQLYNIFEIGSPEWLNFESLNISSVPSTACDHVKLCEAQTTSQRLIKAACDEQYPAQQRWILLATGFLYQDLYEKESSRDDDNSSSNRNYALRAFIHGSNIFRSAMIVSGTGLGTFVDHFRFSKRKASGKRIGSSKDPYKDHSLSTDSESNIYREFKISPAVVKPDWLKSEAARLTSINRDSNNHYAIHFVRSLGDNKERLDKLQTKKRKSLHKELRKLQRHMSSVGLQNDRTQKTITDEPESLNLLRLVRGIDVAGNENDLPIEIFAPTIRALRGRRHAEVSGLLRPERKMHLTIHAGEDYSHIISGLRSLDETITFCDYQHGDRIGHGLALGADIDQWVQQQQRVYLTVGEHLDNLVWTHHMAHSILEYVPRLAGVMNILERKISKWSSHIWKEAKLPSDLYHAWLLRRNCPRSLFSEGAMVEKAQKNIMPHEAILLMPDLPFIRMKNNINVTDLWRDYLYSNQFKENVPGMHDGLCINLCESPPAHTHNGGEHLSDTMSKPELELITAIQDLLIQRYSQMGITFEACPTSNIYIGRFKSYEEHPLFRWYPPENALLEKGGKYNTFGLRSGPLSVCINTDDAGLMPTTIENEHRVIKETAINYFNVSTEVADLWIDRLRQIGVDIFQRNHLQLKNENNEGL
ncbi:antiviral RADAR system adenosine deaminase RdrB [Desulfovibrio gilichinskyi]|uniref:Adenosine/AMP deaminase n=1 Tax=Desulfovibrio gilichinskyi TaxID=1519643 RepID=A0A1X7CE06_9BACT|nr:antiviral RADAR system adenosine deaminase RdrB [Desulfovibrio gilichinskyi]SME95119.1 Adenosine/AMP deaminase [Desulfovibrio gilichinskyi]